MRPRATPAPRGEETRQNLSSIGPFVLEPEEAQGKGGCLEDRRVRTHVTLRIAEAVYVLPPSWVTESSSRSGFELCENSLNVK